MTAAGKITPTDSMRLFEDLMGFIMRPKEPFMSRFAYYLPWEMVTPDELIAFLTIITAKAILSEYN